MGDLYDRQVSHTSLTREQKDLVNCYYWYNGLREVAQRAADALDILGHNPDNPDLLRLVAELRQWAPPS